MQMLELLIFPKRAERKPWELFFIGLLYSSISFLLVKFFFAHDVVLSKSSGLLIVMFASLFSIIFVFYALKLDEKDNIKDNTDKKAIKDDWKIALMFVYLFLGFVIGFAFWQIIFPSQAAFNSQMQTYCVINKPLQYTNCLDELKLNQTLQGIQHNPSINFLTIFSNNVLVAVSTLIFSLLFGAGVIFVIAWNASIIAAVIALTAQYSLINLPFGATKFLLHGIPEMIAYFFVAMAGGMASLALSSFFKNKLSKEKLFTIIRRSLLLVIIGIIVLAVAGLIEVYISGFLF